MRDDQARREFASLNPSGFARSRYALPSLHHQQFETELLQHRRIVGPFRHIENFDTHNPSKFIVDHDAVRDLFTVLQRAVGQVEIDRVGSLIDSPAHHLSSSSWPSLSRPSMHLT